VGRANLRANGVSRQVRCYLGTLPHPRVPASSADLVLANLNSRALTNLAAPIRQVLKPRGWLVASGLLQEHRAQVEAAFRAAALRVQTALVDDDWVTLVAQ